jgi:hypothetical protein
MLDLIEMIRRWAVARLDRVTPGRPVRTSDPEIVEKVRVWRDREYRERRRLP